MSAKIGRSVLSIIISFGLILQIFVPIVYAQESEEQGEKTSNIIAFVDLSEEIANQNLMVGADESDITLPETLFVTLEREEIIYEDIELKNIIWEIGGDNGDWDVFNSSRAIEYIYLPILPDMDKEGNTLIRGEGVILPNIYVNIMDEAEDDFDKEGDPTLPETDEFMEKSPMRMFSRGLDDYTYDVGQGSITIDKGSATDTLKVSYASGGIQDNIESDKMLTLTGTSIGGFVSIREGVTANITFDGLNIEGENTVKIIEGSTVNLTLVGNSILKNTRSSYKEKEGAGLGVEEGSILIITGESTAKFTATGGYAGAGIGGGGEVTGGKGAGGEVTISGGTVIANGGNYGAGIGGGESGSGGTVTISGGIVTATGGIGGAGIGGGAGGQFGQGGEVTISGGNVTATGGDGVDGIDSFGIGKYGGAGIGGGGRCKGGEVNISGGTVTATGGVQVTATGGERGAGIGGQNTGRRGSFIAKGTTRGSAFVIASSIEEYKYKSAPDTRGIIFEGTAGATYGDSVIEWDATIPIGKKLVVGEGKSITINSDVILTNNGTLTLDGGVITGEGVISGVGKFTTKILAEDITIELSSNIYTGDVIALTPAISYIRNILNKDFQVINDGYKPSFEYKSSEDRWTPIESIKKAGTYRLVYTKGGHKVSKEFIIEKANQNTLSINEVIGKKYNDADITLSTTGGSGSGSVIYSVPANGVLSITDNTAKIIGVGEVIVTATKNGDNNYNSTSAETRIIIEKAHGPTLVFPGSSNIIYGQKLSDSKFTGGSEELGSFAWTNGNIIPIVINSGYEIKFTPNADTLKNYETIAIENLRKVVSVDLVKAIPSISLNFNVSGETGSRQAILSARVNEVEYGEIPTGTFKFIDSTSGSDEDIEDATSVAIVDGIATYTWTGLDEGVYKVKAFYNGNENYNTNTSNELSFDTRKQNQKELIITDIGNKTYGDSSFKLLTGGGSGSGALSFESSDSNIVSIEGNIATIRKVGTVNIIARKAEDDDYNESISSLSIIIEKKPLNIKADDKLNVIKGTSIPELTYTSTGLVGDDTFTKPSLSVIDGDINIVGQYDITINGGTLDNAHSYDITYTNGKMTIVNAVYNVKVTNGRGEGSYSEGQIVTISANNRSGYTFTGWTSDHEVIFENSSAKTTSFTMIDKAVIVTANYSKDSSDSGGGSSSDGGGSSRTPEPEPTPDPEPESKDDNKADIKDTTTLAPTKEPDAPTKVIATITSTVTKDTANVTLSKATVSDAIKKAEAEAKKNGREKDGISVEIKVDTKNTKASNLSTNIAKSTVEDLTKAGVKELSVKSDAGTISLDLETLKTIQNQVGADVNISMKKVDKTTLSQESKALVGDRPVFDFTITGSNGKKVTEFGKGKISISLPYILGENERAENLVIYYIDSNGKVKEMPNSVYDEKTGTISFETDHFSKFAIGYKEDKTPEETVIINFTDVANHWAKDDIELVTAKGLFSGTGDDKFSPDMSMTRGMFVTVLGRLANVDISNYQESKFTDIKSDAYYIEYVEWANENGIVEGINQDEFAPNQDISREQMAVILYRYSQYRGYDTTQGGMTIREFEDYENISDYALQSMAWTVNTGSIQGSNMNLMPKDNGTRGQVAAILKRFIETIEK